MTTPAGQLQRRVRGPDGCCGTGRPERHRHRPSAVGDPGRVEGRDSRCHCQCQWQCRTRRTSRPIRTDQQSWDDPGPADRARLPRGQPHPDLPRHQPTTTLRHRIPRHPLQQHRPTPQRRTRTTPLHPDATHRHGYSRRRLPPARLHQTTILDQSTPPPPPPTPQHRLHHHPGHRHLPAQTTHGDRPKTDADTPAEPDPAPTRPSRDKTRGTRRGSAGRLSLVLAGSTIGTRRPPARRCQQWQWPSPAAAGVLAGTSSTGLRSKNPSGLSLNPAVSTGMIGQSSIRG